MAKHPWILHIILGAVLVGLATPVEAGEALDKALADLAGKPAAEAIQGLEQLLASQGDASARHDIRTALASRLVRNGNAYAALKHYEILVQKAPTPGRRVAYAEALIRTARQNLATGNTTAAGVVPYLIDARAAVKPLAVDPKDTLGGRILHIRAETRFYAGELDATLALLEPTLIEQLKAPYQGLCFGLRAQVLYRQKVYGAAALAFERSGNTRGAAASFAADRNAAKAVAGYGALLRATPHDLVLLDEALRAARYAGGSEAFELVLAKITPDDVRVRARYLVARADLHERLGNLVPAIGLLQAAAALDTALVDPLVRIARIRLTEPGADPAAARGRAGTVLLEALKRDPGHTATVAALWFLASKDYQILWKSGGLGPALERTLLLQRALVEAAPDDETVWANLGNTLRVGGRTEEALEAYRRARSENAYDPSIVSDHGLALSAAGRPEAALAAYLASIDLDGSHFAGRQNAGRALWLDGQDDAAAAQLAVGVRKARALARRPMTYRFLLDRVWRTRQDEALR